MGLARLGCLGKSPGDFCLWWCVGFVVVCGVCGVDVEGVLLLSRDFSVLDKDGVVSYQS